MSEFSIQKMAARLMNGLSDKDNDKKLEKQQVAMSPEKFYNTLIGAQLGSSGSHNTAAVKIDQ